MKLNRFQVGLQLAALIAMALPLHQEAGAQSRSISTRNSWLSEMDYYRKAPRQYKCGSVDRLRSYAQMLMEQGDASLARQFNSFLPGTRCSVSPLVIDPSATESSTNPGPNQGTSLMPMTEESSGCTISITQMEEFRRTRRMVLYC